MGKRCLLEESRPCCGKRKQQGANAKGRIPDPGCAKIGCQAIRRIGSDSNQVACWQLSNGDIKTRSSSDARESGGGDYKQDNGVVHSPGHSFFAISSPVLAGLSLTQDRAKSSIGALEQDLWVHRMGRRKSSGPGALMQFCCRRACLVCLPHLCGINEGTHRVALEVWRSPQVFAGRIPVTEVINKQLNAVAIGTLVVEGGGCAVISSEHRFNPQVFETLPRGEQIVDGRILERHMLQFGVRMRGRGVTCSREREHR